MCTATLLGAVPAVAILSSGGRLESSGAAQGMSPAFVAPARKLTVVGGVERGTVSDSSEWMVSSLILQVIADERSSQNIC